MGNGSNSISKTQLQELANRRRDVKQRAGQVFQGFILRVLEMGEGWEIAAMDIGSAYAKAAREHRGALDARAKAIALETQIMFSVLTVITAGSLSWIGGFLQAELAVANMAATNAAKQGLSPSIVTKLAVKLENFKEKALLSDILEDSMQASAGEVFSAVGPMVWPPSDKTTTATIDLDPLEFQNDRMTVVKRARESALSELGSFNRQLLDTPDQAWDGFEEQQQRKVYEDWLTAAGGLKNTKRLDKSMMADEIERGFWARWAPKLKMPTTYAIFPQEHWAAIGESVGKRLKALKIDKDAGLEMDQGWLINSTESDTRKLIDWAAKFKPKNFGALGS